MSGVKGIFTPSWKKKQAGGGSSVRPSGSPESGRKGSTYTEPVVVSPITSSAHPPSSDLSTSNGYDPHLYINNNNESRGKSGFNVTTSSPAGPGVNSNQGKATSRESVTSLHGRERSGSVNSLNSSEYFEAPMVDQEDIIALTHHVRSFSESLSKLRNTFVEFDNEVVQGRSDPPQVKAHERLGEVLSILKGVLHRYPPLRSTDILAAAGTLISKVKSHNYEDSSQAPDEFYESIDQLALAFSSSVSDFLMGDQELSYASPLLGDSQSMEDLCPDDLDELVDDQDDEEEDELEDIEEDGEIISDGRADKTDKVDTSAKKAGELDRALLSLEDGVDIALQRTKIWSKYAKDIATYVERRAHLELDFSKQIVKLVQTTRAMITEEPYLPFQSIFITALDQDLEYASNCQNAYSSIAGAKFIEPLMSRRIEHDRRRKDLRETWAKACKKLQESLANLKKAKAIYNQRMQELEKISDSKDAGRSSGKKKEDEARQKAEEAEDWYRQAVAEANVQQQDLERVKSSILVNLRQLVYQCDMTMKAVTHSYFQMMNGLCQAAPVQFQTLAESTRSYEPGTQFADYIKKQQGSVPQAVNRVYEFEPYGSVDASSPPDKDSRLFGTSPISETMATNPRSTSDESLTADEKELTRHQVATNQRSVQAWSNPTHSGSEEETKSPSPSASPSSSPLAVRKARNSVSSDNDSDQENKENDFDIRAAQPPPRRRKKMSGGLPFRNVKMSEPAKTHIFRKLRAPSRCRVCDSYLYFNGAECELCGLTCHKKCLEVLAILCGFKRLQRRLTTFGVDFHRHLKETNKLGNIPSIVAKCIEEIDSRAYMTKGIYRVSGVKSKVEKLCQVFENGSELVDLSETPPHLIASVLKLYLNQLPEPLLTFQLYPDFMKIAKESFGIIPKVSLEPSEEQNTEAYQSIIQRLRELIVQLSRSHFLTGARLMEHLRKVAEHEDESQMSASNLGIVFGPTLLRPPSDNSSSSSLASLVDTPLKHRVVELLIVHWKEVFSEPSEDDPAAQETPVEEFQPPDPRDKSSTGGLFGIRSALSKGKNPNDTVDAETPVPTKASVALPPQDSRKISYQMGFGNEFFDLLEKSNERVDKEEETHRFDIPEFLLPGSPELGQKDSIAEEEEEQEDSEMAAVPDIIQPVSAAGTEDQAAQEGAQGVGPTEEMDKSLQTELEDRLPSSVCELEKEGDEAMEVSNEKDGAQGVEVSAKLVSVDSEHGSLFESKPIETHSFPGPMRAMTMGVDETPRAEHTVARTVRTLSPDTEETTRTAILSHKTLDTEEAHKPEHHRRQAVPLLHLRHLKKEGASSEETVPLKGPGETPHRIEPDTRWPGVLQAQPVVRTISLESSGSDSSSVTGENEALISSANQARNETVEEMEQVVIDVEKNNTAVIIAGERRERPPAGNLESQEEVAGIAAQPLESRGTQEEDKTHDEEEQVQGDESPHKDEELLELSTPIQRMSVRERLKEMERNQKELVELRQKQHMRPQRVQSKSLDKSVSLALRKQMFEAESGHKQKPIVLPKPTIQKSFSANDGAAMGLKPLTEPNSDRLILELGATHHETGEKLKTHAENPTLQEFRLRMRQYSKPRSITQEGLSTSPKTRTLASTKDSEHMKGRTFFVDKSKLDVSEHRGRSLLGRQASDRTDNKIQVSPRLIHKKREKPKPDSDDEHKDESGDEKEASSTSHTQRPPTPKSAHHGDKFLTSYPGREPKFV